VNFFFFFVTFLLLFLSHAPLFDLLLFRIRHDLAQDKTPWAMRDEKREERQHNIKSANHVIPDAESVFSAL
jgi:hypothetical protein